jgi:hypothetical protein
MTNKELKNKVNELEKELKSIKQQLAPKKITLKEFFESKQELAIHCDTEEKAKKLLSAFDKMGRKWRSGESYAEITNWEDYKEETLYYNDGCYADLDYGTEHNHDVYEFENVDLTLPKEYQFSEDEKTILRNLEKKWKWLARDKDGLLSVYTHKPLKSSNGYFSTQGSYAFFDTFGHLFQSIQWTDDEPVEIAKVIRE